MESHGVCPEQNRTEQNRTLSSGLDLLIIGRAISFTTCSAVCISWSCSEASFRFSNSNGFIDSMFRLDIDRADIALLQNTFHRSCVKVVDAVEICRASPTFNKSLQYKWSWFTASIGLRSDVCAWWVITSSGDYGMCMWMIDSDFVIGLGWECSLDIYYILIYSWVYIRVRGGHRSYSSKRCELWCRPFEVAALWSNEHTWSIWLPSRYVML